ncbi:MAG: septal ring lytic transglycosylase RlpA family protein [Dethiobacter sp.]|nr:septal ring lytic transglycosylase RlpA family protein [Dethiobacter sp.]
MTLPGGTDKHKRRRTVQKMLLLIGMLLITAFVYQQEAEKNITLIIDGEPYMLASKAATVGQLLEEQGLYLRDRDVLWPLQETVVEEGMEVSIERAIPVFVSWDAQTCLVYTAAENVGQLIDELAITVSQSDRVKPGPEAQLRHGDTVKITRMNTVLIHDELPIPFDTERKNDNTIPLGERKVLTAGKIGIRLVTYEVVMADSIEESRSVAEEKIVRQPVKSVVLIGVGVPAPIITASSRSGQVVETMEGVASWYGGGDGFHGSITASGEVFNSNEFTAAHPTLPFGTVVRVTFPLTGKSVDVRINDRGPFNKNRIIDLSRAAAEAIGLRVHGIGVVRIEVIK